MTDYDACIGMLMGSLQLLVALSVEDSLGGSSAYCTVLSTAGLKHLFSYFLPYSKGLDNWWQVRMIILLGYSSTSLGVLLARCCVWSCTLYSPFWLLGNCCWSQSMDRILRWCADVIWCQVCFGMYKVIRASTVSPFLVSWMGTSVLAIYSLLSCCAICFSLKAVYSAHITDVLAVYM